MLMLMPIPFYPTLNPLKKQHPLRPSRRGLLVCIVKSKRDGVFVVGKPAGDEPGDERRKGDGDGFGLRVEIGVVQVGGGEGGAVERAEVFVIGDGEGARGES